MEPKIEFDASDEVIHARYAHTRHTDPPPANNPAMPEQRPEELQVWTNFKNGDKQALAQIYTSTVKALLNYGQKFIADKDIVADLIQDLFIEIWNHRENLSSTSSIKYYLLKALRYKIIRHLNQNKHISVRNGISDNYTFELVFSHESLLIEDISQEEEKEKLSLALAQLTKRQREAIYLRYYNNLSYPEIASLMAVSEQAVYNLVSKALKSLQQYLLHNIYLFLLSCYLF
ncbi:sigma-70 family RNA polymerase sigma factor [Rhodocytophaga rosea]|uniref:Sigma-70 family RNA polymerase sigma factor n=1 Tax=Rhodocytophaga rosea TaxID=2704465 RepID=A0A6C0GQV4_9BACT|nr:sigma-70 family RNA polymerase sigma factor [Rhodocytophaga rosea]QHT69993.1 sigma-70 family RNA polymerase sigma factor [Rhodocytophaga rosea]